MVGPAEKREAVALLRTLFEMSERRATTLVGADRTMIRYRSRRPDDAALRARLHELAHQRHRFGYQGRGTVALVVVREGRALAPLHRQAGRSLPGATLSEAQWGGKRRVRAVERLDLMGWTAPATGIDVPRCGRSTPHQQEPSMAKVSIIGLDLAKNVFQVHGIDDQGKVLVRRSLRRAEVLTFFAKLPSCLIGIEACVTAHHWARELIKLGHTVKLMPPSYVKPYVKRGKTDAADAEAIAEAVTRPTMRFVAVKTVDQQAVLMLHKVRELLVRQRTMLTNAFRGHLAEFGIIAAQGQAG